MRNRVVTGVGRVVVLLLMVSGSLVLFSVPKLSAMTLQEVIAEAIRRNPHTGMERRKLEQLDAAYREARSGLLPHLSVSGSYVRLDPERLAVTAQSGAALYERETYGGIGLSQLLFDGSTNALRKAADRAGKAQEAQVASSENLVVYQAAKAFIQVLETRSLLESAGRATDRARTFEEMTTAWFNAGKVTRLDLLQARKGRIEAEAALVRARELGTTGMALLAALIGHEETDFEVDGSLPDAVAPPPPESTVIEAAMSGNPDMQRLQHLIDRADYAADAARGVRSPSITARAGWGYRDRDIGGSAGEWSAGLQLDMPVYYGGAIGAGIAKADAVLAESSEAERSGRLALQSQLRSELSAWRSAVASVRSTDEAISVARESHEAAQVLYRAGKATALDVLTAQLDLSRAENDRAAALASYAMARAGVDMLVGSVRNFTLNHQD